MVSQPSHRDGSVSSAKPTDGVAGQQHTTIDNPHSNYTNEADIQLKPDSNPWQTVLNPLIERDTELCNSWKEEVQNILIFAGLFSAVVTAFIIESYQQLQPDPSDAIVALLSRIASQMDPMNAPGDSSLLLEPFSPYASSIRVNIFWFISLILSLTVALIGIISLQWLREHQKYDSRLDASKTFAIFNTRSAGLRRWHVAEIFAALPLLLQAALVLFLAGIVDLLFSLRREVAIPVTIVTGMPCLFLIMTTALPALQLYTMRFPYWSSINLNVPTPCPYKSPQSLIFRRISNCVVGRYCAFVFTGIYTPLATLRRLLNSDVSAICGRRKAAAHSDINIFQGQADPWFKQAQIRLTTSTGDWTSTDELWLEARTTYAATISTPQIFRAPSGADLHFVFKSSAIPSFYDAVRGIQDLAFGLNTGETYTNALYHIGNSLIARQLQHWSAGVNLEVEKTETRAKIMRGRYTALMMILGSGMAEDCINYASEDYTPISSGNILPDVNTLHNAYNAALLQRFLACDSFQSRELITSYMLYRWSNSHIHIISPRILDFPEDIFMCTFELKLIPGWLLSRPRYYRELMQYHIKGGRRTYISNQWTDMLRTFLNKVIALPPWSSSCPHLTNCNLAMENTRWKCKTNFSYNAVVDLMICIVTLQVDEDIIRSLALLKDLCQASVNPVRDRPLVVVVACAYVSAVTTVERHGVLGYSAVLQILHHACGSPSMTLHPGNSSSRRSWAWDGLWFSLEYIRNYQACNDTVPSSRPINTPDIV